MGKFGGAPGLRAYVEIDLGGPVTFGSYSYITDAFRLLGCSTVYEEERCEWLKPDLREVAASDPDAIVYEPKMYATFGRKDFRRLVRSRGWENLRAVRARNAFMTPRPLDFLAHHGPSFVTDALPWLQRSLKKAEKNLG